ncbi:hypothetical protein CAPTEDRAFT_228344 [Capitella teleta]|uniref:ribonuclease Z n=1 Tax=Capitella teleta TaxID=283909 RepID=R7VFQ4_CAPTE|nr:hypothetical protein CAPTEDRAFT_228344 [Capitella teleta]|eukprot:ELU17454.1 hypothetical protein CAPTEDRAFT_228344 [Capitella teleta]
MSGQKSSRVMRVIGCHDHATKALVLTANQITYFFNCPEGIQRALHCNGLAKTKEVNILVTRNIWSNIGGLIGACLFFQEGQKSVVRCHGSNSLKQILSNARGFSQFEHQPIVTPRTEKVFTDDFLKITYVPLMADATMKADEGKKRVLYDDEVTSYIIEALPLARRIDMEKCVLLGIKQGPMVGQLKKGEAVTLPDGTVIEPEQVLRDAEPVNPPLLVVDCPSDCYITSLNNCEDLQPFYADKKLSLVVHLTPGDVMLDAAYIHWMKRFGADVQHLVVNELGESSPVSSVHWFQSIMNLIDSKLFPLLHDPFMKTEVDMEGNRELLSKHGLNVTLGRSNLKYLWSRTQMFDANEVVTRLDVAASQEEALQDEDFKKMLQEFLPKVAELRDSEGSEFPRFTFLGTASASPSKYRNVSGILLQAREDQYFILDCGESSLIQMILHYGVEKVKDILINLDLIYISHLHPDHHLGFFTILLERQKAFASKGQPYKPLEVVTCQSFENWYRLVETYFGIPVSQLIRHTFVENFQVNFFDRIDHSLLKNLNLSQIRSVHMHHTQFPFGVRLNHADGWSVVYSGDTMPCDALVKEGHGCDVLIHEATFMEGMESEATFKNHSTMPQALKIAREMEAKFTLLTHFSQRFPKIPLMPPEKTRNAGSAVDHLRVSMKDLHLVPLFKPLLLQLFKEDHHEVLRKMSSWMEREANREPRKKHKVNQRKRNYKNFSPLGEGHSSSSTEDLSPKRVSPSAKTKQAKKMTTNS